MYSGRDTFRKVRLKKETMKFRNNVFTTRVPTGWLAKSTYLAFGRAGKAARHSG